MITGTSGGRMPPTVAAEGVGVAGVFVGFAVVGGVAGGVEGAGVAAGFEVAAGFGAAGVGVAARRVGDGLSPDVQIGAEAVADGLREEPTASAAGGVTGCRSTDTATVPSPTANATTAAIAISSLTVTPGFVLAASGCSEAA
ncbi:hypothetical protein [Catenuloplanes japonicus]|uniref:hypothetical protein n=1 Tax=Catenuloplanes japonicus TaxID=33876 RepID=UPI0012F98761|nr:hypothetical protein [Catenuloplanes japonicus]